MLHTKWLIILIVFGLQGSLSSRIFSQIGLPESHLKSWHADQCQVCSTHLNQLKWEAVSMVHTLEESQFLAYYNIPGYVVGPNAEQVLRKMEKQRPPVNVVTAEQSDRGLACARPEDAASSSSFLHRLVIYILIPYRYYFYAQKNPNISIKNDFCCYLVRGWGKDWVEFPQCTSAKSTQFSSTDLGTTNV